MKQFNLEQAKAGKPVCTRDGRKSRILAYDVIGHCSLAVAVDYEDGEYIHEAHANGSVYLVGTSPRDLFMASEKKEGWFGIYSDGDNKTCCGPYPTKNKAENVIISPNSFRLVHSFHHEWVE
jgi:hypothetical protein